MKKLRFRFVVISVFSVFLVLASIVGTINFTNFKNVDTNTESILNNLLSNGGQFNEWNLPSGMSQETPYETRYFSVKYNGDDVTADTTHIAAISESQAIEFANDIISQNSKTGYVGVYGYKVSTSKNLVVFVDCTKNIETANKFLRSSIFASILGLVAVFVVALILSKIAINPIIESYEKQKEFITNASHELKTPLTVISANNELIEMTTGETENTQAISKQVAKMTTLVKNLTALSKLQEFDGVVEKGKFCLSDLIKTSIDPFLQVMQAENKKFSTEIEENIQYVGDKNLINQLLSILLENASKYSITKVNLSLHRQEKNIILKISNDGSNIKKEELNKCFDRFYRAQETRASNVNGSGIGLSLAKEIVNFHNGKIYANANGEMFEIVVML